MRAGNKTRLNAALILLLALSVGFACKMLSGNETADANKLVDAANDDIKAAKDLQAKNEAKLTDYKAALNNRQWDEAGSLLNGAITDIDKGVKLGESAADKFDQASKKKIDPIYKDYLVAKADAVRKRTDSYKELKNLFETTRNMLQVRTADAVREAQPKMQASQSKIRDLDRAANDADDKAEKIRRENPDKFKA